MYCISDISDMYNVINVFLVNNKTATKTTNEPSCYG